MLTRLLALLLLLAAPSCKVIEWAKQHQPPTVEPAPAAYVVTPGQRIEKTLRVPCGVSFDIKGVRPGIADGGPDDNKHFAWAYERDFAGGNSGAGGGYVAGARSYALKTYHASGIFADQKRYPDAWDPATTYHVEFQVTATETSFKATAGGVVVAEARIPTTAPGAATVGIGWPQGRPGFAGSELRDVVWTGAAP